MGRPKAWLRFGQELMLPRVVRILSEVVSPVVVAAAPGQDIPPLPVTVEIARDPVEVRGPLQGLATGIDAIRDRVDAVYLSSCDVPFLQPAFIRRMVELLGPHSICVPRIGEFYHPLAAVYKIEISEVACRLLADNRARMTLLFERLPTRIVDAAELTDVDPTLQSLRNLNSLKDYERALCDLSIPSNPDTRGANS